MAPARTDRPLSRKTSSPSFFRLPALARLLALLGAATTLEPAAVADEGADNGSVSGTVSVGLDLGYFDYQEELSPPLKSSESGPIATIQGSFELHPNPNIVWLSVFANYSPSSTTFIGTTNDPPVVPIKSTTGNQFFKVEGKLGVPVLSWLDLYAGLGYRSWLRRLDYDETYSWKFAIFGLRASTGYGFILPDLRLRFDASARPTFGGDMRLENYLADSQPATLALKSRCGARVEVPVDYRFGSGFSATLSPYFEFSAIGSSDRVPLFHANGAPYNINAREPSSTTKQYGSAISLNYTY